MFGTAIIGGSSVLYNDQTIAILPLSNEEAMMVSGIFDRTRPKFLAPSTLLLEARQKVVIVSSPSWATGDTFLIEGDPQKIHNPAVSETHIEGQLVKQQE